MDDYEGLTLKDIIGRKIRDAAYDVVGKTGLDEIKQYGYERPEQLGYDRQTEAMGPYDAARHILSSAAMTQKYGPGLASLYGTGYENLFYPFDPNEASYQMDIHNNRIGRELGIKYKTREEVEAALGEMLKDSLKTGKAFQPTMGRSQAPNSPRVLTDDEFEGPSRYDVNYNDVMNWRKR